MSKYSYNDSSEKLDITRRSPRFSVSRVHEIGLQASTDDEGNGLRSTRNEEQSYVDESEVHTFRILSLVKGVPRCRNIRFCQYTLESHFGPFGQRGVHTTRNPFDGVVQVFSRDGLSRRLGIRMSERKEAV